MGIALFLSRRFYFCLSDRDFGSCRKIPEFQKLGVEILSMSIDSVFVHKMWNDNELSKMVKGGVPFPMLSDAGGKVGSVFGIYDDNAGVETRGRFIIDPDGVVQGYEVLTPPVGRNIAESMRQVQAFQLVRNSKEQKPLHPAGDRVRPP